MKRYRYQIVLFILFTFVGILISLDPIPQDLNYHNFADKRVFFGIPNFWDVISTLPMFFLGTYGMYLSLKNWNQRPGVVTKWLPIILCLGIFTACFGSMYYHVAPENNTLVWDRLPMTLMFMPIFSLLIYDFIGKRSGEISFFILIPLGIFSIFYWQYTESIGAGDLRLYVFVQFFPMVIAPFILWLFPKKVSYTKYISAILIWYTLAKFSESYDYEIYSLTGFWSGHTIKHLLGSISLIYVLKLFLGWEKELISTESETKKPAVIQK